MEELINILHAGGYSCVIAGGGMVRTFTRRGVTDLYDLLKTEAHFLKGASVADKVIGKGAATLLIKGGVKSVYSDLMSEPAYALLVHGGVEVHYKQLVPHIRNWDKTDWCPLEKRCDGKTSLKELLIIVDKFITDIRSKGLAVALLLLSSSAMAQEPNLLNQKYEITPGFPIPGATIMGDVNLNF